MDIDTHCRMTHEAPARVMHLRLRAIQAELTGGPAVALSTPEAEEGE